MADDNAQYAYKYFQSQYGLNKAAAAGLVGNLAVESENFNPKVIADEPSARGDGGLAHGIAQWHPDRWQALGDSLAWAPNTDPNHPTFVQQLDFVALELHRRGQFDALNKINDPRAAADYVDQYYEASAGTSRTARENDAVQLYQTGDIKGSGTTTARDITEVPGAVKDSVTSGVTATLDFAKSKLFDAGIGILGILAVIGGFVLVVMSTKTGRDVVGTGVKAAADTAKIAAVA